MVKKIVLCSFFVVAALLDMVINVNAARQSETKGKLFWEDYLLYQITGDREVDAIAIDWDYARHQGYYDNDIYLKGTDYYPETKVTFTFPSSVNHDGIEYTVTGLPDHKNNKLVEARNIDIVADGAGSYSIADLTIAGEITTGNGLQLNSLNAVTKVVIPDTFDHLGSGSLADIDKLEEVEFAKKYKYLTFGDNVFGKNHLKSISIPEGTYKLGDMALGRISDISFPKSLKKIGSYVVNSSTKRVSLAEGNTSFKFKNGILYSADEKTLYSASANVPANVSLPKKVSTIMPCAFAYTDVKTIKFKNSRISKIPDGAFANCKKLTKITGLKSVKNIGYAAFAGCTKLKSIGNPKIAKSIAKAAFWDAKLPKYKLAKGASVAKYAYKKPK